MQEGTTVLPAGPEMMLMPSGSRCLWLLEIDPCGTLLLLKAKPGQNSLL